MILKSIQLHGGKVQNIKWRNYKQYRSLLPCTHAPMCVCQKNMRQGSPLGAKTTRWKTAGEQDVHVVSKYQMTQSITDYLLATGANELWHWRQLAATTLTKWSNSVTNRRTTWHEMPPAVMHTRYQLWNILAKKYLTWIESRGNQKNSEYGTFYKATGLTLKNSVWKTKRVGGPLLE